MGESSKHGGCLMSTTSARPGGRSAGESESPCPARRARRRSALRVCLHRRTRRNTRGDSFIAAFCALRGGACRTREQSAGGREQARALRVSTPLRARSPNRWPKTTLQNFCAHHPP
eukprot:5680825-Prymnesium_polylepis.1